jgi:hypothetical protein
MINSPIGAAPAFADVIGTEGHASEKMTEDLPPRDRRLVFAIDPTSQRVLFADGPSLAGANFFLVERLGQQFRSDLAAGTAPHSFGYVSTELLMKDLKIDEQPTLGQRVLRTRRALKEQFLKAADYVLNEQDFIESHRWRGYRLNPYLVLVEPAQLHRERQMSRHAEQNVMTRHEGH